jgi:predicted O-methyltransferase YrrM
MLAWLERLPLLGGLLSKRREYLHWSRFVDPGHFYSPIPSDAEIARWCRQPHTDQCCGINRHEAEQWALLQQLAPLYPDLPFTAQPTATTRYGFENPYFGATDGVMLALLLRYLRPRRLVEVGSGFSSGVMLDVADRWLPELELMCIDPDPARLRALLRPFDADRCVVRPVAVQEIGLDPFVALEAGDVLFIDSSHVTKAGSDVNYLFFEVLPRLQCGVWVHVHDVAATFDYTQQMLEDGIAWNEAYLVRAFLTFNDTFQVRLQPAWWTRQRRDWFASHLPVCLQDEGCSLWLERVR